MGVTTRQTSTARGRLKAGFTRYGAVIRLPGAMGFFVPSIVARMGVAMTGLGILWAVRSLTGSFALAGIATGTFALSEAVVGPQIARAIDRYGQTRVLPVVAATHLCTIVGLMLIASQRPHPVVLSIAAGIAGASIPQPGALSSARWIHAVNAKEQLGAAFSLEAVVNDVVFLVGPLIVTVLSVAVSPIAGVSCATIFVVAGVVGLAANRATAPPRAVSAGPLGRIDRRLFTRSFLGILAVNACLGVFFGAVQVGVTAFAIEQREPGLTGLMLGVTSAASLVSGLVFGGRQWRGSLTDQLLVLSACLALATFLVALAPTVPLKFLSLALAGLCVAPLIVTTGRLIERTVPTPVLTQAFTWTNSASAAGIAASAVLVGTIAERGVSGAGLVAAATLVAVAPLAAALGGHSGRGTVRRD